MLELISDTDDVMDISSGPNCCEQTVPQKIFIADLGSQNFCIGVYKYNTPGSVCSWIAIFKIPVGMEKPHPSIVATIASASKYSPIFILRQDTMGAIASISATTGMNKRLSGTLLVYTLPKFTYPYLCFNIPEQQILDEITASILCRDMIDSEDDVKLVSGMHVLNIRGNM